MTTVNGSVCDPIRGEQRTSEENFLIYFSFSANCPSTVGLRGLVKLASVKLQVSGEGRVKRTAKPKGPGQ